MSDSLPSWLQHTLRQGGIRSTRSFAYTSSQTRRREEEEERRRRSRSSSGTSTSRPSTPPKAAPSGGPGAAQSKLFPDGAVDRQSNFNDIDPGAQALYMVQNPETGQYEEYDPNNPNHNHGLYGADKDTWARSMYIGQAISRPGIESGNLPADTPYFTEEYISNPDVYAPSGMNVFDEETGQPIGFDPQGTRAGPSIGRDAYLHYWEATDGPEGRRAYLQQLLWQAGYVAREDPIPTGGWGSVNDEDYADAWSKAIQDSQATGIPLFQLLNDEAAGIAARYGSTEAYYQSEYGEYGAEPEGPQRPTLKIISEEDTRAIIDRVSQQTLGRTLSAEEEGLAEAIVAAVREQMTEEGNAIIDQEMEGGGVVSEVTSPEVSVDNQISQRYAEEEYAYSLAQAFANLLQGI